VSKNLGIVKSKLTSAIALVACLAFGSFDLAFSESPKSTDPIKLAVHGTGNFVTTGILSAVLQKAGYKVEPVRAEYMGMWPGLESGDIDVAVEVWSSSAKALMEESTASGKTENLGETGLQGFDRWWFPSYVKEKCPGLPDWKALNELKRMPGCVNWRKAAVTALLRSVEQSCLHVFSIGLPRSSDACQLFHTHSGLAKAYRLK
jgi:ABC-type proline/glycine betaine transport system substrate-binding protein